MIEWPSSALRAMSLIDTPGLASISAELSASTELALTGEATDSPADDDRLPHPPPAPRRPPIPRRVLRQRRDRADVGHRRLVPSRRGRRRSSERDGLCSARRLPLLTRSPIAPDLPSGRPRRRIDRAGGRDLPRGRVPRVRTARSHRAERSRQPSDVGRRLRRPGGAGRDHWRPHVDGAGGAARAVRPLRHPSLDRSRTGRRDADLDAPCGSPHRAERSRRPTALVDAAVRRASATCSRLGPRSP